jgi:hypothetical protein
MRELGSGHANNNAAHILHRKSKRPSTLVMARPFKYSCVGAMPEQPGLTHAALAMQPRHWMQGQHLALSNWPT